MSNVKTKSVNFIINGKGGIGKSFISSLLCQYYMEKDETVLGFDTDPNNSTLANIDAINTSFLKLLDDYGSINSRAFDGMMEIILAESDIQHFVIDCGATTFIPLLNYIKQNEVLIMLKANKFETFLHIPIVGGQAKRETIQGFEQLADTFTSEIFLWINEYHGSFGDIFIEESYIQNKEQVSGIVRIEEHNKDTFGQDIYDLTIRNLTFKEAMESTNFTVMSKQRLRVFKEKIFNQLKSYNL